MKMASDVAQLNHAEIIKLNEEANASKEQASLLSLDNFNYNQAVAFQNSAEQLADEALKFSKADDEKDPVIKVKLLEQATSSENTAIAYYQKSNKLWPGHRRKFFR